MLSIGIRHGEGFDQETLSKLMLKSNMGYDYDVLIIGGSPGGIAFAKQAKEAGKRVVIINKRIPTDAEQQNTTLDDETVFALLGNLDKQFTEQSEDYYNVNEIYSQENETSMDRLKTNQLDFRHFVSNVDVLSRRFLHFSAKCSDFHLKCTRIGWRVPYFTPSLNWSKLTENILDQIMLHNWNVKSDLKNRNIDYIEAQCKFKDEHSVIISLVADLERTITSEYICIALESTTEIPAEIPGARKFGIVPQDVIRLTKAPGKTLIVGFTTAGLEYAGIFSKFGYPVVLIDDGDEIEGCDLDMAAIIVRHLESLSVRVSPRTTIVSIDQISEQSELLVRLSSQENGIPEPTETEHGFETVLFTKDKNTGIEELNLSAAGLTTVSGTNKLEVVGQQTFVPNISAVGDVVDCADSELTAELAGKLLGIRMFHEENTSFMYNKMFPRVIFTPTEYACAGLNETEAILKFGECVEVNIGECQTHESLLTGTNDVCHFKVISINYGEKIIVGLHIFGPDAAEIIQGFSVALQLGMTLQNLKTTVGVSFTKGENIFKVKKRP